MKKRLFFVFVLMMTVALPTSWAQLWFDAVAPSGQTLYYYVVDGEARVDGYSGTMSGALTIPSSVEYGDVTYPVTRINEWKFGNCSALTSVTLPASITYIGYDAFYECTGLTQVNYSGTLSQWMNIFFEDWASNPLRYAHHLYIGGQEILSLVIPDGTTEIKRNVFMGGSGIETVTIPASVDTIGEGAFGECTGLARVYCSSIADWCGIAFANDQANPINYARKLYVGNNRVTDIVIPSGIITVKPYAFYNLNNMNSIVIPEGVQKIGRYAFWETGWNAPYTIPSTITTMGENAVFGSGPIYYNAANCTVVRTDTWVGSVAMPHANTIIFGEGVQNIPRYLLPYDDYLYTIKMRGTPPTVSNFALDNLREHVVIQVPCGMQSQYQNATTWSDLPNTIQETTPYVVQFGNAEHGSAWVTSEPTCTTPAVIYAGSDVYYHFVRWNDGNTSNPRSVTLTSDTLFTPEFAIDTYTVSVAVYDDAQGWVSGGGVITAGESITITAHANPGYRFIRWDDWGEGCENAVRIVTPTESRTYHAQFEIIYANDTMSNGEVFSYMFNGEGLTLTGVSSNLSGDVVIPDSVLFEGVKYPVTRISNYVFYQRTGMTTVTLPATLKRVDYEGFYECSGLTRVNINGTLGDWCAIDFESCWSNPLMYAHHLYVNGQEVINAVIPEGYTIIERNAFRGLNGLQSVTIPSTIDSISYDAFEDCNGLLRVNYGGTLAQWCGIGFYEDWGSNPLIQCGNLYINGTRVSEIVIPDGVTEIKPYAFQRMDNVTRLVLPDGLLKIGQRAFENLWFNDVTIPSSVVSVGEWAIRTSLLYYNATNCTNLVLNAFPDAPTIVVGDNVQSLPTNLINNNLNYLKMQGNPPTVGEYAFDRLRSDAQVLVKCGMLGAYLNASVWSNLTNISESNTYALRFGNSEHGYVNVNTEATCSTPATIEAYGTEHHHFVHWADGVTDNPRQITLTQDTIVTPVFAIDTYTVVLRVCNDWNDRGNVVGGGTVEYGQTLNIEAHANTGYHFTGWSDGNGEAIRTITPEGNQDICANFDILQHVEGQLYYRYNGRGMVVMGHEGDISGHLVIPDSITYDNASIPVVGIDNWALSSQYNMTAITIPATMDSISYCVFNSCDNLTAVYYTGTLAQWCGIRFEDYGSNPTNYAHHLYIGGEEVINVTIPEGVTSIGRYAFLGCTELANVTLPSTLDTVGYGAFENCNAIGRTRFTGTIAQWCNIGFEGEQSNPMFHSRNFFLGSSRVTTLNIPAGVTAIKQFAFMRCNSITSVTMGSDVQRIDQRAFESCDYLTSVEFSPNIKSIGEAAFRYCSNVQMFDLPDSLKSIATNAFWDCWNATIVIPAGLTSIEYNAINSGGDIYYNAVNCTQFATNAIPYNGTIVAGEDVQVLPYGLITNSIYTLKMLCEPPVVQNFALDRLRSDAVIRVHCGLLSLYQADDEWNEKNLQESNNYSIRFTSSANGSAGYNWDNSCNNPASIYAWPNNGWHFKQWSDGDYSNPREVTVTQDTVFTPLFSKDIYDTMPDGNIFYYYYNGEGLTLGGVASSLSGAVVIPDSVMYEGVMEPVTKIWTDDFHYQYNITSLTLPKNLNAIHGFYDCSGLTRVNFNGTIGQWCQINFDEWYSNPTMYAHHLYIDGNEVLNAVIPEGVTVISSRAFRGLDYLTTVTLPSTLDSIGDEAFADCYNLQRTYYNGSIADWCNIGFYGTNNSNPIGCTHNLYINGVKLTELVIPEGVTTIKTAAFHRLYVDDVVLPESLIRIGDYAFDGVWLNNGFTIPSNVVSIGTYAIRGGTVYFNATNCTEVEYAFCDMNTLIVGENVQSLSHYLFNENVYYVRMQGNPPTVSPYMLNRMSDAAQVQVKCGLLSLYQAAPVWNSTNLVETNTYALRFGTAEHGHAEVQVPATCTTPASVYAYNDSYYHFVNWTDGVTDNPRTITLTQDTLITPVFAIDTYFVSVAVYDSLQGWVTGGGYAIAGDSVTIEAHPNPGFLFIRWDDWNEDSVRRVQVNYSTEYRPTFEPISFCDSLESGIKLCYAFNGAGLTLTSVEGTINGIFTIPDSVTYEGKNYAVTQLNGWVFQNQNNMTWITLPKGLKQSGCDAFSGCEGLTRVNWNGTIAEWCDIDFECWTSNPIVYARHLFVNGTEVVNLVIPEGVNTIKRYAFQYLSSIASVTLPSTLDSISYDAFNDCNGLQRTYFNGTIAQWCNIGFYSGWNSNPLTYSHNIFIGGEQQYNIIIPEGVTYIKPYTFNNLYNINTIELPEGLQRIGREAFNGTDGNYTVTIPSTVVSIDEWAFTRWSTLYYNATNCTFMANNALPYFQTVVVGENVQSLPLYLITGNIYQLRMQGYPPSVTADVLDRLNENAVVQVKCGLLSTYQSTPVWNTSNLVETNTYAIKFGPYEHGYVQVSTEATCTTPAEVFAWGEWLHHFVQWTDGVTDNPRTMTLTQDTVITPIFAIDTYTVAVTMIDSLQGWVSGSTTVIAGDTVTIEAHANTGFVFNGWDDWGENYQDSVRQVVIYGYCEFRPMFEALSFCDSSSIEGLTLCYSFNGTGLTLTSVTGTINGIFTIPDSAMYEGKNFAVTRLSDWVFQYQEGMTWVTIPTTIKQIGCGAFYGCNGLTRVNWNGTIAEWCDIDFVCNESNPIYHARHLFVNGTEVVNLVIPEGVSIIGQYAFTRLASIASVTLPSTLDSIGYEAFYDCNGLQRTNYNGTIAQWCNIGFNDGWGTNPLSQSHNLYIGGEQMFNIIIPEGVTNIKPYTFYSLYNINTIELPEGLLSIGREAFNGTDGSFSVTIPSTVVSIDEYAFTRWYKLYYNAVNCTFMANNALPYFQTVVVGDSVQSLPLYLITGNIYHLRMQGYPPSVTADVLDRLNEDAVVEVKCGLLSTYQNTPVWNTANLVEANTYAIKFGPYEHGSAGVNTEATCTTPAEVGAWGDWHYHFVQWTDGVTDNPRTITLTQDTMLTPVFAIDTYYVVGNAWPNSDWGYVTGNDTVVAGDSVTLTVHANYGYHFTHWSDWNEDSVRTITPDWNWMMDAVFEPNYYNITLSAADSTPYGQVNGSSVYSYLDDIYAYAESYYGYHFVQWEDGNTDNPRHITVTRDSVLKAVFAIDWYSIIGYVTSDSQGNIRGQVLGSDTVPYMGSVTLTAVPAYGYYFQSWSDSTTANPYTVYAYGDQQLEAYFGLNQYSISLTVDNDNHGSVTGSGYYDYLTNVTFSATPAYGYHFSQWSDGNSSNPRSITVTGDSSYTAIFARNYYTASATAEYATRGSATVSADSVLYLDTVIVTAVANYGYHFTQWSDGVTDNPRFDAILANSTFVAQFDYNQYNVSVAIDDTVHGVVGGSGTYQYLSVDTVYATAAYGYHFTQWSDGVTDNPRSFTLTQDTLFTAEFAPNSYQLTVTSNDSTIGAVSGSGIYSYLDQVQISATVVQPHHHFVRWSDGSTAAERTVTVTCDTLITAIFAIDTHSVAALIQLGSAEGVVEHSASGNVVGIGDYPYGYVLTLQAVPAEGYHFAEWDNGETTTERTITVESDTVLAVIFTDDVVPSLCMVNIIDDRNVVIWDKELEVDHYNIYRESSTAGVYSIVAVIPYDSASMWVDADSRPSNRSYRYKMTAVDVYGYESDFSVTHKTMHLYISPGMNNNVWNLSWTEYEGADFVSYMIYRGSYIYGLELIDEMSVGGNTSYTDDYAPTSTVYYQVVAVKSTPCFITKSETVIRSNIAFHDENDITTAVEVPFTACQHNGNIVVEGATGERVEIYDVLGRRIASESQVSSDAVEFKVPATGVYLVKVGDYPAMRVVVTR